LFREALASLISTKKGYQVVGQAADGRQAVKMAGLLQPDLVLMDISMPVMDGIEATRMIKEICPEIKIVMLTMSDQEPDLLASLKAGADGYLLKDSSPRELFARIEEVMRGQTAVPEELAGSLLSQLTRKKEDPVLSSRECQILRKVAAGDSNKEIAALLGISENTVKKHVSNIMDKLGMNNRTQLALYAKERGIADRNVKET
jgi:DNA-binding NarL/FixJ family response regulator